MSNAQACSIRAYLPGDEHPLAALHEHVFGRPQLAADWLWKLNSHGSGIDNVWLAIAEGKPVFQYAGIPQPFRVAGSDYLGMVSVDTMTDPRYRRQGLLSRVGARAYDEWRKAGVDFVIGLPNEQWGSRKEALGWVDLFPLEWFVRTLKPEALIAKRLGMPWIARLSVVGRAWRASTGGHSPRASIDIKPATSFDSWQEVERPADWLRWRYLEPPGARYQIMQAERGSRMLGYIVFRMRKTVDGADGIIAELNACEHDKAIGSSLLHHASDAMEQLGAVRVRTLATANTWRGNLLERAGFSRGRFSRGRGFTVGVVPLASNLPIEAMKNPANWELTGGDFDVV